MIARMTGPRGPSGDVDPRVIERAIWGDRTAFEALLRHYNAPLRRFAYRLVGDEVDDVLQEAYLRAFRAMPTFDDRGVGVAAWLFRIVYRAAVDSLRQRSRRLATLSRLGHLAERRAVSAESEVMAAAGLAEVLAMLPVDLRAVAMLVDAYGLPYEIVANVLDIPAGTVASRLHRARDMLRNCREYTQCTGGDA
jgi:RNA polymerase sigma-70 factor, ECF subfamily